MRLQAADARARFGTARVVRLCTVGARPHPVPVTFALAGDVSVTAVDHKPKATRDLQRIRDIEVDPGVVLLADHYEEDWSRLWWARAEGTARVLRAAEQMSRPLDLLVARYPQYEGRRPAGPVIQVDVERWSGWAAR